jgi:hypothetical protein
MHETKEKILIKKYADQWRKDNGYKDFLEEAEKEKAELNESYKESVRQAKERKKGTWIKVLGEDLVKVK